MDRPLFMLDTTICLCLRKGASPRLVERFEQLQPGQAVMSIITYGELLHSAEKSQERKRALDTLGQIITLIPVVPMSVDVGPIYGTIRAELEQFGPMIGGNDLWIAAHAIEREATLVTTNCREFDRVSYLNAADWTMEEGRGYD